MLPVASLEACIERQIGGEHDDGLCSSVNRDYHLIPAVLDRNLIARCPVLRKTHLLPHLMWLTKTKDAMPPHIGSSSWVSPSFSRLLHPRIPTLPYRRSSRLPATDTHAGSFPIICLFTGHSPSLFPGQSLNLKLHTARTHSGTLDLRPVGNPGTTVGHHGVLVAWEPSHPWILLALCQTGCKRASLALRSDYERNTRDMRLIQVFSSISGYSYNGNTRFKSARKFGDVQHVRKGEV
jgi:hypothetical protein